MSFLPHLSRRSLVAALPFAFIACSGAFGKDQATSKKGAQPQLLVYKTPACGCCNAWAAHVRKEGFAVRTVEVEDTALIAAKNGVPASLRSCHTAIIEGYAIEGHVPAREIRRLLAERPMIAGLAVPGMPIGSPGMEMGDRRDRFAVIAFARDGLAGVFATY